MPEGNHKCSCAGSLQKPWRRLPPASLTPHCAGQRRGEAQQRRMQAASQWVQSVKSGIGVEIDPVWWTPRVSRQRGCRCQEHVHRICRIFADRAAFALNGKRGAPAGWRGLASVSSYPMPPKRAIDATRRRPSFTSRWNHYRIQRITSGKCSRAVIRYRAIQ